MNEGLLLPNVQIQLDWFTKPAPGHIVQFYDSKLDLLTPLEEYIAAGVARGDSCVVIAKQRHVKAIEGALHKRQISTSEVIFLDAKDTLAKFMVDGLPNREKFFSVIGGLLEKVSKKKKPIRAYGEMVALLWEDANGEAVLSLESLWNELFETYRFSLFCAYPALHFIHHELDKNEIIHQHSHLVPVAT